MPAFSILVEISIPCIIVIPLFLAYSNKLNKSRQEIANMYTDVELYSFLIKSATEANARRFKTPELRKIFKDKMNLWKEITIDDENNKGPNLE